MRKVWTLWIDAGGFEVQKAQKTNLIGLFLLFFFISLGHLITLSKISVNIKCKTNEMEQDILTPTNDVDRQNWTALAVSSQDLFFPRRGPQRKVGEDDYRWAF